MRPIVTASSSQLQALRSRREFLALPEFSASRKGLSPESLDLFTHAAQRLARRYRTVGASVILVFPEGVQVICLGRRSLHPPLPVLEDTAFRVASITKTFVSAGILSYFEQHGLSLDAPIRDLLPLSIAQPVTMRHLLTHTAGLVPEVPEDGRIPFSRLLTRQEIWSGAAPGEQFVYSNLGAGIAGAVAELLSGLSLQELLARQLFSPLGIEAGLGPAHFPRPDSIARGYRVRSLLPPVLRYDPSRLQSSSFPEPGTDYQAGIGRLCTTPRGIAAMIRFLSAREDTPVLSLSMLEEMRSLQDGKGGIRQCGRGLGVAFLPDLFPGFSPVGHQGVAYGMCAEMFCDPATGTGVGILTSGTRLSYISPLILPGFDLLCLGFEALRSGLQNPVLL